MSKVEVEEEIRRREDVVEKEKGFSIKNKN